MNPPKKIRGAKPPLALWFSHIENITYFLLSGNILFGNKRGVLVQKVIDCNSKKSDIKFWQMEFFSLNILISLEIRYNLPVSLVMDMI